MQTTTHIQTFKSILYTVDNYFPLEYANNLFDKCKKLNLDVEPEMRMGIARRCIGFYSDESIGYKYSGQVSVAKPLPDYLREFLQVVNVSLKTNFNGLLINYYRNGQDSIGSHADAEKDLFDGKVAAITLMNQGGTRKFRLRDIKGKPIFNGSLYKDIQTKHNQLLVMFGDFQKEFKHEVPVEKSNLNAERISITLRYHKK